MPADLLPTRVRLIIPVPDHGFFRRALQVALMDNAHLEIAGLTVVGCKCAGWQRCGESAKDAVDSCNIRPSVMPTMQT